jgi:hypothetical protein
VGEGSAKIKNFALRAKNKKNRITPLRGEILNKK